jgi:hypothetical protein
MLIGMSASCAGDAGRDCQQPARYGETWINFHDYLQLSYVIYTGSNGPHTRYTARFCRVLSGPSEQGKMLDYDTTRNLTLQFVIHFARLW